METIDTSSVLTLISKIHSDSADFLQKKMKAQGLPNMASSHGNILFRLAVAEKLTMTELARLVNRDKSTLTVLVRKLEREGFIVREVSTEDARVSYIKLSEKGREYAEKTVEMSHDLMETCYNGFSEEEKVSLFNLLTRISENFS